MVETLVPDRLWHIVQPLLPVTLRPKGGGQFACPRATLAGIIYVLKEGIRWNALPKGYGFPSGVTCWRRLRDWQVTGLWQELHHALLNKLHALGLLDLSRASLDSASVRALKGGISPGVIPRIEASSAPNVTSSWIGTVCPWLCCSQAPTRTTA